MAPQMVVANPSYGYTPGVDPGTELERLEAEKEAQIRDTEEMKKHVFL